MATVPEITALVAAGAALVGAVGNLVLGLLNRGAVQVVQATSDANAARADSHADDIRSLGERVTAVAQALPPQGQSAVPLDRTAGRQPAPPK